MAVIVFCVAGAVVTLRASSPQQGQCLIMYKVRHAVKTLCLLHPREGQSGRLVVASFGEGT